MSATHDTMKKIAVQRGCFLLPIGCDLVPITKPPGIESDAFKSAKWDELTQGRAFSQSDVPALSLLCQWYKIAETAQEELDNFGGQTAYSNDMGDLKAFPQIGTLKTASAEIRQLNKQLGICDTHEEVKSEANQTSILSIVSGNRAQRQARTA